MLEMLLDKKLLFVLMGILTGLGVADKCIVSMTMKRMVEAAGSMSKSNHPLMRLVRAKFEHACMISDTVENVGVFVDKYLYEYKVCGLRLHTLRRLEKICAGLLIVIGFAGAGLTYQVYGMGDAVLRTGAVGCGLGILVWLFHLTTDENYCMQMAKNYMVDYLENVCLHKYEKVNQKEHAERIHAVNEMTQDGEQEKKAEKNNESVRTESETSSTDTVFDEKGIAEAQNVAETIADKTAEKVAGDSEYIVLDNESAEHVGAGQSVVQIQREDRRKERTKGTARNLARASARLSKASNNPTANNPTANNSTVEQSSKSNDAGQNPELQPGAEKDLPKEELIRQILQEFMA